MLIFKVNKELKDERDRLIDHNFSLVDRLSESQRHLMDLEDELWNEKSCRTILENEILNLKKEIQELTAIKKEILSDKREIEKSWNEISSDKRDIEKSLRLSNEKNRYLNIKYHALSEGFKIVEVCSSDISFRLDVEVLTNDGYTELTSYWEDQVLTGLYVKIDNSEC